MRIFKHAVILDKQLVRIRQLIICVCRFVDSSAALLGNLADCVNQRYYIIDAARRTAPVDSVVIVGIEKQHSVAVIKLDLVHCVGK